MNLQANHLSRLSTEIGIEEMDDEFLDGSLFAVQKVPLWYSYIAEFLSTQAFPATLDWNERCKIQVNSTNFAIITNKLYWRGIDGILRRCVDYTKVSNILEACHDSACGGYFSRRLTGQKILRAGYYWPTLFADVEAYAKKCDACQRYAWNDLQMDLPLQSTLPISPLEKWGIDYIGPIAPMSRTSP